MPARTTPERLIVRQDQMLLRKNDVPSRPSPPKHAHAADEEQATRPAATTGIMAETFYTLDEIAKQLKVSKETARRTFAGQ
jgi:hypothetical protein